MAAKPTVEILFFDGCPNHEQARALVEDLAAAVGVEPELRLTEVRSPEDAERLRFLGSPSVRVNGRDTSSREPTSARRSCSPVAATGPSPG